MKFRFKILLLIVSGVCLLSFSLVFSQQNKYKLKPGASGNLCLECHDRFKDKLKSQFVHTPVKSGECSECHNPHTSSHGKLLYEDINKVCFKCHEQVVPSKMKSVHNAVIEGNCVKCHDPHASNNKFNLLKAGNELCFSCHKAMGDTIAKVRFKHSPVEKGCLNCHDPHGSAKGDHLLKDNLASLCGACHKPDNPAFVKQHMNYPVGKTDCSSCHDAHGSDSAGILYANVHAPVASKSCSQCHEASNAPTPFKTKRPGYELCRGCHSNVMNEIFSKNRVHWPIFDRVGCLNCHQPHASTQKKLLNDGMVNLCGKCHSDTLEKQRKLGALAKRERAAAPKGEPERGDLTHQPVQEGNCGACHSPHASDSIFLMDKASVTDLCGTCHDWQKHSSHPIGEKVTDTRNKNLTMDCLSCHRAHGTEYRWMLTFKTTTDLCVQCHVRYKR